MQSQDTFAPERTQAEYRRTQAVQWPPPSIEWALTPQRWDELRDVLDNDPDTDLALILDDAVADHVQELRAGKTDVRTGEPLTPTTRCRFRRGRLCRQAATALAKLLASDKRLTASEVIDTAVRRYVALMRVPELPDVPEPRKSKGVKSQRVSLMLRDGRRMYEIQWNDPTTGMKRTVSTGTSDRTEAEQFRARKIDELNSLADACNIARVAELTGGAA